VRELVVEVLWVWALGLRVEGHWSFGLRGWVVEVEVEVEVFGFRV
jgi:hypothetical protein